MTMGKRSNEKSRLPLHVKSTNLVSCGKSVLCIMSVIMKKNGTRGTAVIMIIDVARYILSVRRKIKNSMIKNGSSEMSM